MRAIDTSADNTLRLAEFPKPSPEPSEVLVRVLVTSVNRLDIQSRLFADRCLEPGRIPGCDAAGIVEEHGPGVEWPPIGTMVAVTARPMGLGSGTYAEWIAVPTSQVVPVPPGVSPATATCIAFSGLAAYQAIYALMPESHETILINGASGAVGTFAIQLAKRDGARVICNTSASGAQLCLSLGADLVVDGRTADLGEAVRLIIPNGIAAELDLVDGTTHASSVRALAKRGRIVSLLPVPERSVLVDRRIMAWRIDLRPDGRQVAELLAMAASGRLRAVIAHALPLEAAARAHGLLSEGGIHGKIVLEVSRWAQAGVQGFRGQRPTRSNL